MEVSEMEWKLLRWPDGKWWIPTFVRSAFLIRNLAAKMTRKGLYLLAVKRGDKWVAKNIELLLTDEEGRDLRRRLEA